MALATADLTTGEQKMLTQNGCESFAAVEHQFTGNAVDNQCLFNHVHFLH